MRMAGVWRAVATLSRRNATLSRVKLAQTLRPYSRCLPWSVKRACLLLSSTPA